MTKTKRLKPKTALEAVVVHWVNKKAADYTNGQEGVLRDLAHGGCSSGMVSDLIYTQDCAEFYRCHAKEIDAMLYELLADCGGTPASLFERAGWDNEDPFAREDQNQNILAWFGFEETAHRLAQAAGFEF